MSSYRLRSARLREAAAARGDHSNYAIAKRTGLNQTTLSRISRGVAKPAAETLLVLSQTYELSIEELIERQSPGDVPQAPPGPTSAGNDEATRGPAGSPLSNESAPTSK